MKEIKIPIMTDHIPMSKWLKENNIGHCWFSGKGIIAFIDDQDASALMLIFGGTMESAIDKFKKQFEKDTRNTRKIF